MLEALMKCIANDPVLFTVAAIGAIYDIATGKFDRPKRRNTDIRELFRTIIFTPRKRG